MKTPNVRHSAQRRSNLFHTKIDKEKMTATPENLQVMNLLETFFFLPGTCSRYEEIHISVFLNVHKMFPAHSVRLNHVRIHPFIVSLQLEPSIQNTR